MALVQLGFSAPVAMQPIGDEVQVGFTMTKMVAKMSVHRGWAHGPHPAGILVTHFEQFVDENAFDSVLSRGDGSFLFHVHNVFEDVLLSKSGRNGLFIKRRISEIDVGTELFWLEDSVSLEDALSMAEQSSALGLVEKGAQGRWAIRFRNEEALLQFTQANQLQYGNTVQRWKVSGVPMLAGLQGLHQLLSSRMQLRIFVAMTSLGQYNLKLSMQQLGSSAKTIRAQAKASSELAKDSSLFWKNWLKYKIDRPRQSKQRQRGPQKENPVRRRMPRSKSQGGEQQFHRI